MSTDSKTTDHKRIRPSGFRPARWLRNRHLQTIYPSLPIPGVPRPPLVRETLELPDGDVTAVDWLTNAPRTSETSPLLVVLHGLESSAQSSYARQLLHAASRHGWRASVLHFRDCGDYRNRLPRRYHAGETDDLRYFLRKLKTEGHRGPLLAAGFSLGGNVLLKYLGENGDDTPLVAAAAISVPLKLRSSAEALTKGFSRIYQRYLINRMKRSVRRKFNRHTAAFDWDRGMRATTFAEFDDAVTAPLHGFASKDDYYDRCSSVSFLGTIARPTLILNALDDPFMAPDIFPDETSLSEFVTLEISENGGHVGFIHGGTPWRPQFYVPQRIIDFLEPHVAAGTLEDAGAIPGL
jgi:predicted alpha/beta-fold hydrolase